MEDTASIISAFMTYTNFQGLTGKGCNSHLNNLPQINFDNKYNFIKGVLDKQCGMCVAGK